MFSVTTPLGPNKLDVSRFTLREGTSELFELDLDVTADRSLVVAFDKLLGQSVTVTTTLADGSKRHLNGIARAVTRVGATQAEDALGRTGYRLKVVPSAWLLTRRTQSRTFQQMAVPDILKKVLTGITATFDLKGTYEPRNYCVQYRESDFDFASRIMEEEGISYFFKHADGSHTMMVVDTSVSLPKLATGSTIRFEPIAGGVRDADRVHAWEKSQELTSGEVTLFDHSFELPHKHLEATSPIPASLQVGTVSHKLAVAGNDKLEVFDYPGDYAKRFDGIAPGGAERASELSKISQDNARTAKLRMQEIDVGAVTVQGASNCRQFVTGNRFTLENHPDGNGEYVLTRVEHTAAMPAAGQGGEATYANTFTCIPSAAVLRPPRRTPRPRVHGCQTAVVVGPKGEEIFTDKFGRVKVQFHWDRDGKNDSDSSCWVRVASSWAGREWGGIRIPRIDQEVVVDFLEGDPDRPIIVGSVYNAEQMPPYKLPANKTQSGVKSRSTPKGAVDAFNEIRFEDLKDKEHIHVQAQKDLVTHVKNAETRTVLNTRTTTITKTDERTVTEGDDLLTVKKGKQTISIDEGDRKVTIAKGNDDLIVSEGNQTIKVDTGNRTVNVKGDETSIVQTGNRQITVKTGFNNVVAEKGDQALQAKVGNISIKADAGKITLEAAQEIELKVGSVSIKLAASGITMRGPTFKVAATGAAEMQGAIVRMEGQAMLALKSPMAQLNGDGMLMMKGGVTMIN